MARKLSPEKALELERLYTVLGVISDWYAKLGGHTGGMEGALRQAYEKGDLAGLRMAYNDFVEMTAAADAQQRRDLDRLLRERANTTLEALAAKQMQRIDRIRARGRLTSEEQYYLVREHVEFCFDVPERAEEVKQLFAMMHEYEDRIAARARAAPRPPRETP